MDSQHDNVRHMDGFRKGGDQAQEPPVPRAHRRGPDLSKPALILAALALVLMAILFFGLSSNLKGLTEEVRKVGSLQGEIASLQAQMALVRDQPTEGGRKLMVQAMLEDMAQKAAFLGGQIQDQDQARKMAQVQETLRQIQYDLSH
jgi:hypothetical protein